MKKEHLELGKLVRDYRIKKDFTQHDLAEFLGYETTQFVSLFERGLSKIPLATLGKLISILGIPEQKVIAILMKAYKETLVAEISSGKSSIKKR